MQQRHKKKGQEQKQTRERLSLHGHNPEEIIRAFMQVPVKRVIKKSKTKRRREVKK